nr:hypothetical protein [Morchella crassipes]
MGGCSRMVRPNPPSSPSFRTPPSWKPPTKVGVMQEGGRAKEGGGGRGATTRHFLNFPPPTFTHSPPPATQGPLPPPFLGDPLWGVPMRTLSSMMRGGARGGGLHPYSRRLQGR